MPISRIPGPTGLKHATFERDLQPGKPSPDEMSRRHGILPHAGAAEALPIGHEAFLLGGGPEARKRAQAKQSTKKSSLHNVLTTHVFMHIYFKKLAANYTDQQFFDYLVGQSLDGTGRNRFEQAGMQIVLHNNPGTAVTDLKASLKTLGSVVVYFGHTVLGRNTTLGLNPAGGSKPAITNAELVKLLNAAKAKIVLLAGCATDGCVRKVTGDTVVIVTRSGKDRLTNTLQWAPAVRVFLDELLLNNTVGEALAAANGAFAKVSTTDSFKMINGDPTLKLI